jgi:hypothetical protein
VLFGIWLRIEHEIYRNDVDFEPRGWVREICGAYSRRSRIRFYVPVPSVPKAVPIPYAVASFDRPAMRHDAVGSSHRYHRWPIDRLVVEDDHETTSSRNKEAEALL